MYTVSNINANSSSDGEKGKWSPIEVELTDRGIGGKFVTRKK